MKILVTGPVNFKFKKKLETLGEVDYEEVDKKGLRDAIGEYEVVVIRSHMEVDAKTLSKAKKLKVLARYGVGVDNIDLEAAEEMGIKVVNAPTSSTTSVAEHAIALILAVVRQLPNANWSVVSGEWNRNAILGMELAGKTVGFLGYGRIGKATAARLRAFGCNIIFHDPAVYDEGWVEMEELFKKSDILVVCVPLTEETFHLVDGKKLALMQKGAFLVNVARGEVVDTDALEESIENLGGVCLDVFEEEPPEIRPFMKKDNVILTPHVAANTTEARIRVGYEVFDRIKEAL